MKKFSLYFVLLLAGLIFIGSTASAQKKTATMAAEDLKYQELPNSNGALTAVLWGDQNTGPFAAFTKFPAGFKGPLHYHTSDFKIVVIKGAYTYNGKKYGPGSYLSIPGGDKHVSGGVDDSETIFYIESTGKFDVVPVEEKK